MNIQPITPTKPACFGLMCQQHMDCQRYHAIDGSKPGEHRIYMCSEDPRERPLFEAVKEDA